MEEDLSSFMAKFANFTEEETAFISEVMPVRMYPKGTILLREGQIATECYMNLKGLVRRYIIVDGEERTTEFYTEEQPIASLVSYNQKIPADHYFSCLEDTTLAVLSYDSEQLLNKKYPHLEKLCRVTTEVEYGNHQSKMARFMTSTPEEQYQHLMQTNPDLLNRVPQYHLASYLGIKPESLSRIRKRMLQKS
jgi:CRP-like cAMP-binding protein